MGFYAVRAGQANGQTQRTKNFHMDRRRIPILSCPYGKINAGLSGFITFFPEILFLIFRRSPFPGEPLSEPKSTLYDSGAFPLILCKLWRKN